MLESSPAPVTSASLTHERPLARVLDASGDLALAGLFLLTWLTPGASLALPLSVALLTMLLEFIVVHSTGFMGAATLEKGSRAARAKVILGFGAFYTLFVGGFALAFGTWWPLIAFWALTLNRSLGVLFDRAPSEEQALRIRKGWAAITMSYLFAVTFTTLLPMPDLGIDAAARVAADLPSSGLWVREPQRVVAAGVLHFGASAVSSLFGHRWISDSSIPRRAFRA